MGGGRELIRMSICTIRHCFPERHSLNTAKINGFQEVIEMENPAKVRTAWTGGLGKLMNNDTQVWKNSLVWHF